MGARTAAVAATERWVDPDDGIRYPAGEVHAWVPGHDETVCGLSLSRSRLARFPHVTWTSSRSLAGTRRGTGSLPPLPGRTGCPEGRSRLDPGSPASLKNGQVAFRVRTVSATARRGWRARRRRTR